MYFKRYFFEIPIYRISQERFNQKYDNDLQRYWEQFKELSGHAHNDIPKTTRLNSEQSFWETYCGPWRYNQVFGWMRLYILGSQVRGDLWRMVGKRFHRKTRNQIRPLGKAFEIDFFSDESSEQILAKVEQKLEQFQKKWRKKKRVLDLECFRTLSSCINWRKLVDMEDKESAT